MQIKRELLLSLSQWKDDPYRKPLILQGARQVGKTWVLREFGKTAFDDLAEFNFDENPDLKRFFETTKDVKRILQNLSLVHGRKIDPQKTLILFDEIQECPNALNSLKYFCEKAPEYHVVCAGSLLGVALNRGASFPVGKVDFMQIFPLSFTEFLSAAEPALLTFCHSIERIEPIPDIFFNRLLEKCKMYFISGGMPEATSVLLDSWDVAKVQQILQSIVNAYNLDFSKHIANKDISKLHYIWKSLPSQLARENKKFFYQTVKPGARARDYEDALQWLENAGLVHKVYRCTKPALPLKFYDDLSAFKIYMLDVGLLRQQSGLKPQAIVEGNRLFTEFKGALAENYILTSLVRQFGETPRYWTSAGRAEIDFILQEGDRLIPIEVKSDENVTGKSLAFYQKEQHPELCIRYSLKNLKHDGTLINIPLFLADLSQKFIKMASHVM
jgi:Predicted ATPase (AAA+ superfamily)